MALVAEQELPPATFETKDATSEPAFKGATRSDFKIIGKEAPEKREPEIVNDTTTQAPVTKPEVKQEVKNIQPLKSPNGKLVDNIPASIEGETGKQGHEDPPAGEPGEPGVDGIATPEQPQFFEQLSEQTGYELKSVDDIVTLAQENQELRTQLSVKPEIEFPNEQAKFLYNLIVKNPGKEIHTLQNTLHVVGLGDPKNISEKQSQFEHFALKYQNRFTRDEARKHFDSRYAKKYGEEGELLKEDLDLQFDHKNETEEAREALAKAQEEFTSLPSENAAANSLSPEQFQEIEDSVSNVVQEFGGVSYQINDDPKSVVSIPMEQADVEQFSGYLKNPNLFLTDVLSECQDAKGNLDWQQFAVTMFEFKNRHRIREQVFNSGVTFGQIQIVNERKNSAPPRQPEAATGGSPASFKEAWRQAVVGKK